MSRHIRSLSPALLALGLVLAAPGAPAAAAPEPSALSPEEARWLDSRLPNDERRALDQTRGFAPPAPADGSIWLNSEPISWESLRGKVVVIQSFSTADEAGRAAVRRVTLMLERHDASQLQVIALHTPQGAPDAEAAAARQNVGVPVLVDPVGRLCDDLGVWTAPTTIVIDRNGAIRYPGVTLVGLTFAAQRLLDEEFDPQAPPPEPLEPRSVRDPVEAPSGTPQPAPARPAVDFPSIRGPISGATDIRGKQGPRIVVEEWMNGEPETEGKVVIVEFWATWCPPCRKSIPHLNDLARKFGDDLVILGITNEDAAKVHPFMKSTPFRYTVARDTKGRMMSAPSPRGIPHAFIMSPDGIVRWQGNPLSLQESAVEQIIKASGLGDGSGPGAPVVKRWVTEAPAES